MVPEWVLYAKIPAQAVRLYAVLRRHANDNNGHAWPSRRRLADMTDSSPATVTRGLNALREIGAVDWVQTVSDSGDLTSNDYVIHKAPPQGRPSVTLPGSPAVDVGSPVASGGPSTNGRRPPATHKRESFTESHESEPTNESARMLTGEHSGDTAPFDDFWSAFPARDGRKTGKGKCLKLWADIPTAERSTVVIAAKHYAREAVAPAIMNPATFLTDDSWRDWVDQRAATLTTSESKYGRNPLRDGAGNERPVWRDDCALCGHTGVIDGGDCVCADPVTWLALNDWIGPVPDTVNSD